MSILATYSDADTFIVSGNRTDEFSQGRRVKAYCGSVDGYKYGTVLSSSYTSPDTTVNLTTGSDDLTSNLEHVDYGLTTSGSSGTIAEHDHTGEGEGGLLTKLYINDTANADLTYGMTINQLDADNDILSFKSSDVAHAMTSLKETDTYGCMGKVNGGYGGLRIEGFAESSLNIGVRVVGYAGVNNTTTATNASAPIYLRTYLKSGASAVAPAADDNLMVVAAAGDVRFIVKGDGDIYYDGADQGAYDDYEDALACSDLSYNLSKQFGKVIKYNAVKLHNMGVISCNGKDIFVSTKGLSMLQLGAIGELYRVCTLLCDRLGITYEEAKNVLSIDEGSHVTNN